MVRQRIDERGNLIDRKHGYARIQTLHGVFSERKGKTERKAVRRRQLGRKVRGKFILKKKKSEESP